MLDFATEIILKMKSNRIANYIAPGLNSSLIGREDCKVRLFEMTKDQDFYISPHNHRFEFACLVLEGEVRNHIYRLDATGDVYQASRYIPAPNFGLSYSTEVYRRFRFKRCTSQYHKGEWYGMTKDQYHSIEFSRGAKVLFFEGAAQDQTSNFLEPVVNGKVIPTFKVEDWMYHE